MYWKINDFFIETNNLFIFSFHSNVLTFPQKIIALKIKNIRYHTVF
jgi:hypothetical protein